MREKRIKIAKYVLFALMPLLAGVIYCLNFHKSITDIFIPYGSWNDELNYYKQIEGMIHFGIPRGYFAYNDVSAPVGTMGAWCFLLFLPYVIFGKIFGWNYLSPVVCNILLVCIGFLLFAFFSKKSGKTLLAVGVLFCTCPMMLRYMLSGMVEALFYMCMLIYAGLILRMWEDDRVRWPLAALGLGIYLTIIRPYFVLLMLIPLYHFWTQRRRNYMAISLGCMIVSVGLYFVINSKFCAPYFIQTIDLTSLRLVKEGHLLEAAKHVLFVLKNSFSEVFLYMGENIESGQYVGEMWLYFFAFCIFLGLSGLLHSGQKRKRLLFVFLLALLFLTAVLVFYSPNMGSRHMLLISVFLLAVLAEGKEKYLIAQAAAMILISIAMPRAAGIYNLPYKTDEGVAYIEEKKAVFEENLNLTDGYCWDNSVMQIISDTDENQAIYYTQYNMLYALPKGMGISMAQNGQVLQNGVEGIRSKYIITTPRGKVQDAALLAGDDKFLLFLNPKYDPD